MSPNDTDRISHLDTWLRQLWGIFPPDIKKLKLNLIINTSLISVTFSEECCRIRPKIATHHKCCDADNNSDPDVKSARLTL